ncbi:MAG: hypothetical protein ACI4UF_07705, partial [Thermoguttaceae bacterium]
PILSLNLNGKNLLYPEILFTSRGETGEKKRNFLKRSNLGNIHCPPEKNIAQMKKFFRGSLPPDKVWCIIKESKTSKFFRRFPIQTSSFLTLSFYAPEIPDFWL